MPHTASLVDGKAYRIPQDWHHLPFVNQTWIGSSKQTLRIRLRRHKVLLYMLGIVHVDDALGYLL